ncbi:hypothetical protein RF11_01244 [Thelohanellus kitauei]|uniref:Uncharacterized protein n=1 Tax=Thelohanellus kitauei TaxID=669202 RepID=A0A0C2NLM9_THEKT|nr:hypothetical protein RF11_01244 [Thelohanellus kitauei]
MGTNDQILLQKWLLQYDFPRSESVACSSESQRFMNNKSKGKFVHLYPRTIVSTWILVLLVASSCHVVLSQYTPYSLVTQTIHQSFGGSGVPVSSLTPIVPTYAIPSSAPGPSALTIIPSTAAVHSHEVYFIAAPTNDTVSDDDTPSDEETKSPLINRRFGGMPSVNIIHVHPTPASGGVNQVPLTGTPSGFNLGGLPSVPIINSPSIIPFGGLSPITFNSSPTMQPYGVTVSMPSTNTLSALPLGTLSPIQLSGYPMTASYGGQPSNQFTSSPSAIAFGSSPSIQLSNSPTTLPVDGLPSVQFTSAPATAPFRVGVTSILTSPPSMVPFTGQPMLGANADPNQFFKMMQGLGGLQVNQPSTAAIGNAPSGYLQMSTSPQFLWNSAVNPISSNSATGVTPQPSLNQFSNIPQAVGTPSDFLREYLKGLKDGFEASHSRFKSAESLWSPSTTFGSSQDAQTVAGTNTNSICDYAKHNCPPANPQSQFSQYPFQQQPSMGMLGSPEAGYQQGVRYPQHNDVPFQAPSRLSEGLERPLQYGEYITPQSVEHFVISGQSMRSFPQQTPPTLTGFTAQPPLDYQSVTHQQHLSQIPPQSHSHSNAPYAPAYFQDMPRQF